VTNGSPGPTCQGVAPISTPCIRVCVLDPDSGLCLGCGRTIDEIARWAAMTEAERTRIMADLPRRKADHGEAAEAERP
jgi:predicted Fe-S protein YdhL (DUF1289 family)